MPCNTFVKQSGIFIFQIVTPPSSGKYIKTKTTTVKKQSSFLCQMIENEFASFDRSIESFFDAAKKKKWRCQIEKREQCNQMVKKASFIKVEKTFHLTRCVS